MGRFGPPVGKYRIPLADRFWKHVHKTDRCWEWTAALNLPESERCGGYGVVGNDNRGTILAHRASWIMAFGDIPAGMNVCHTCDNRKCVRPDHLFLGTQKDNVHDMLRKGRQKNQFKFRTHCIRGHEYTPENTRMYGGVRWCRTCARERNKREMAAMTDEQRAERMAMLARRQRKYVARKTGKEMVA